MIERPIHYCSVMDQRRFLEVCECLVHRRKEQGPLAEIYYTCSVAINKHTCPAVKQLYPKVKKNESSRNEGGVSKSGKPTKSGGTKKAKPRKVSSRGGRKGTTVRKGSVNRDTVLLPSLPKQGVPKNTGRKTSKRTTRKKVGT